MAFPKHRPIGSKRPTVLAKPICWDYPLRRSQNLLCIIADHALNAVEHRHVGAAYYWRNAVRCPSFLGRVEALMLRILIPSDRIKHGCFLLNAAFRCSKWIALAAVPFLLSASLDNVPDCPELLKLNASSGPSVSLLLVPHDVVALLDSASVAHQAARPSAACTPYLSAIASALTPSGAVQSLYQAADPSPPSA
jgi:hypothetical protein